MDIKELKEKAPLADVYEFNPAGRYLVVMTANGDRDRDEESARVIYRMLDRIGVHSPVLIVKKPEEVRFFDFGEPPTESAQ